MITVRWISGSQDRTYVKDEMFPTRRTALEAISRMHVTAIRRLGRMYLVAVKT